jgi:hypothetical protein
MAIASAKFEAKQVYLPERASWLPDLEAELFSFPASRYDDRIDSISRALNNSHTKLLTWLKWADLNVQSLPTPSTYRSPYGNVFSQCRW